MGGLVAAAITVAAGALAKASIGALIAKALLGAALNFGLSAISNGLFGKKASAPKQKQFGSSRILTFREPVQSREVVYGEVRKGGSLSFVDVSGSDLYMVLTLAGHEVDSIREVYFAEEVVPLDVSGNAIGKYAGYAKINKHLGGPEQQADPELIAAFPDWTEEHKGQGIAHIVAKLTYNQDKYPNGAPTLSALLRGRKVTDPRTGLTLWSDNAQLCIADYLKDPLYGLDVDDHNLPEDSVIAGANASDEIVAIEGNDRAVATPETSFSLEYNIQTVWENPPPKPREGGGSADPGSQGAVGGSGSGSGGVWT
ncbi:hypothetical protein [Kiloniella majae]|uniref:hypothetical protein n=1 Tax=Kiloniella majae TaxID=1938558 RepID=UPI000A277ED4|nr:hypothetical protein [Kiloniella majae]